MTRFHHPLLSALYLASLAGIAIGGIIFIATATKKDPEYENFLSWPSRLMIYGIAYAALPPLGFVMGFIFLRKPEKEAKRFGRTSIFIALLWSLQAIALLGGSYEL